MQAHSSGPAESEAAAPSCFSAVLRRAAVVIATIAVYSAVMHRTSVPGGGAPAHDAPPATPCPTASPPPEVASVENIAVETIDGGPPLPPPYSFGAAVPTKTAEQPTALATPPPRDAAAPPFLALFVAHHAAGKPVLRSPLVRHVQGGYAIEAFDLGFPYNDADGADNVSALRNELNELTSLYWVHKNYDTSRHEFVGVMQYRRYFNLAHLVGHYDHVRRTGRLPPPPAGMGVRGLEESDEAMQRQLDGLSSGADAGRLRELLWRYDIVVTQPFSYPPWDGDGALMRIMHLIYPVLVEAAGAAAVRKSFTLPGLTVYHNMFIATPRVFALYSEWLFGIVRRLRAAALVDGPFFQRARQRRHVLPSRLYSTLAERLQNIFLYAHPELRVLHLPHSYMTSAGNSTVPVSHRHPKPNRTAA
jgi:hypothetical protein